VGHDESLLCSLNPELVDYDHLVYVLRVSPPVRGIQVVGAAGSSTSRCGSAEVIAPHSWLSGLLLTRRRHRAFEV
jgi:hypothetical protein